MIFRTTSPRTSRPALRRVRTVAAPRPLRHRLDPAAVEEIPFRAGDGVRLTT